MSIDTRAIAWHHLFPAGSSFTATGGPSMLREAISLLGAGDREDVLVSWNQGSGDLPSLDRYHGIVAINASHLSRRDLRDAGFAWVRQFAILPSLVDSRWFIPLDSSRAAAAAVGLHRPLRASSQAKHAGLRAAARTGMTSVFRHRVTIAQRTPPALEQALARSLGTPRIELAILTGTPGPARKPTIAAISPKGKALAFVKIASTPLSRHLIENEVACLRALAAHPFLASRVPEVLFAEEINGSFVLAQRSIEGQTPGTDLTDDHRRLLEAFGGEGMVMATNTAYMRGLEDRITGIADRFPDLARTFATAQRALEGVSVRQTIVHGDFAPWNLRYHKGELRAYDWEYGVLDGLPLIDELYHLWQPGLRLHLWSEDEAFRRLMSFQSAQMAHGLAAREVRAIQVISLLQNVARKVTEGHSTTSRGFIRLTNLSQRLGALIEEEAR